MRTVAGCKLAEVLILQSSSIISIARLFKLFPNACCWGCMSEGLLVVNHKIMTIFSVFLSFSIYCVYDINDINDINVSVSAYLGYQGHSQSYLDQGGNFVGHTKFNATNLVFKAMIFFWLNFTDDQLSILIFVLVKISSNFCLLHNKFELCAAERPTANIQVGASCVIYASVCLVPACFLLGTMGLLDRCLLCAYWELVE